LAKGEAMPVKELARRIGKTPAMTSKHRASLRGAGLVVAKYGRIYQLIPAIMPAPGATHLDFGDCLLKLQCERHASGWFGGSCNEGPLLPADRHQHQRPEAWACSTC
jgi:hypothetical protein